MSRNFASILKFWQSLTAKQQQRCRDAERTGTPLRVVDWNVPTGPDGLPLHGPTDVGPIDVRTVLGVYTTAELDRGWPNPDNV